MERWKPDVKLSEREKRLLVIAGRSRKLFVFLREQRHVLFDDSFQDRLESMYRQTGAGEDPNPPALMCMAMLLQCYMGVSDAEAVRLSGTDKCWRMVLGILGGDEPAFSQGSLQQARARMIAHDMDRELLEHTVAVARDTRAFDWKKLPKTLRVAVDSRPLEGAGRVEDTINLLGHAARKIAECAATILEREVDEVCHAADAPVLTATSTKAGLDIDWNDASKTEDALNRLVRQVGNMHGWVMRHLPAEMEDKPLRPYIDALLQVQNQDLERADDGRMRIREGVAEDRRVSIEDAEMRHGRKSKTKRFNGFKEHVATHLDADLILPCAVTAANRPEEEAAPELQADMERMGLKPDELDIDRAYVNSKLATDVQARGGEVICKPWKARNNTPGMFTKADFNINVRDTTITCPAGVVETFDPGQVVAFDPEDCGPCPLRSKCTQAATGRGRTVTMGEDEKLQKRLRRLQSARAGRARLRERVAVEHSLAHLAQRQGRRARYIGKRKNLYDLRRHAAIQNLESIARRAAASAAPRAA